MNARDQDDLDHLPSLSLTADERSDRTPAARWPLPQQDTVSAKSSGGWSTFFITFLMLSLFTVSGLGYWQLTLMHKELAAARTQLQNTTSRLLEVSGTVYKTDESFSRNEGAVKDELKAVNFEIRKLWDLANKANKPEIERQGKQLTTLLTSVNTAKAELSSLTKQLRTMNVELSADATLNREQVKELETKLTKLSSTLQTVAANSKKSSDTVNERLRDYQDEFKAFDAHRQQVSKRLIQLENSVRSLSSGGNAGGLTIQPG